MTNPLISKETFQHGVFMNVFGVGILLTGESGVGKSELALTLIDRGHQLIADDMVALSRQGHEVLGRAPEALQGLLELRGLGIFNIKQLWGEHTIKSEHTLSYILHLQKVDFIRCDVSIGAFVDPTLPDPVVENLSYQSICGLSIPQAVIPFSQGRQRRYEFVIETLVRHFQHSKKSQAASAFQNHFSELGITHEC